MAILSSCAGEILVENRCHWGRLGTPRREITCESVLLLLFSTMKERALCLIAFVSALVYGGAALVPPEMGSRRKVPQIPKATSEASVVIAETEKGPSFVVPPLATWKRRLNTKQDSFSIHKLAGLGWWLSSTVIFGAGAVTGFAELPKVLEPFTYLFLASTMVQSMSSIPMALRYRSNEPVARRGFISSAITTTSLAFTGYWLSPFAQDHPHPPIAAAFIALLVSADAIYSLTSFGDMKKVADEIQENNGIGNEEEAPARKYTTLISMSPVGLPMNAFLLYHMLGHLDHVRDYFLSVIALNGSTPELVYYASMVTSISVCVGNLAATLYHRKLISKDIENLATIGAIVVTLVFNIRAAGSF